MIRPICKDPTLLAKKAELATSADRSVAADLLQTLTHHQHDCVGMAANMIGETKRIIAFDNNGTYMVMYNPEIVKQSGPYWTQEGCLSLPGMRPVLRFQTIQVRYQDESFQTCWGFFTNWTAQIIQHEIDHCNGILI